MSNIGSRKNDKLKETLRANQLFIDCQILQTSAYDRGMGKYTLNLLRSLLKILPQGMDVRLIFNANLTSDSRINEVIDYINGGTAESLDLPTSIDSSNYVEAREQAESTMTAFLRKESKGDDVYYLMTAPFFVGFPSVFPRGRNITTLAIVYDITPQKIWNLQRIFPDDLYFSHYKVLLQADYLLTISNAVKDDIVSLVGIDATKVIVIDGGPMLSDGKVEGSFEWDKKRPYILHVTAPIVHKNNERAVRGFALFNKRMQHRYTLYITSHFSAEDQAKLLELSPDIVFSGNISDEDLANGYKKASAVLFSSLAEGLGMPVLEAGAYRIPVACSRIPVLEELSPTAFYLFDPLDASDIAKSLEMATRRDGWNRRQLALDKMHDKYTWERSASILYRVLENARTKRRAEATPIQIITPPLDALTPASYLVNILVMYLEGRGYEVDMIGSLRLQSKIPPVAHYIAHSESVASNVDALTITVRNAWLNRGIRIELSDKTLRFKTFFAKDKALGLCSWEYSGDNSPAPLTAYELSQSLGARL